MNDSDLHLFDVAPGSVGLLLADGSRVHELPAPVARMLEWSVHAGRSDVTEQILNFAGIAAGPFADMRAPNSVPIRALSLAVAQTCNLGCTYCYARGGDFGGPPKSMTEETAIAAVRLLLLDVGEGERVNLAFLGGEPLVNRRVVQAATIAASALSAERGIDIGFTITTNGTLLIPEDADFFDAFGFSVTVSLDGVDEVHDRQRSFRNGNGTYRRIVDRLSPLLRARSRMRIGARVTVTPRNLQLAETLDGLIDLGFDDVGFSPMLSSPTGRDQLGAADLDELLQQMIKCGQTCEQQLAAGAFYPFSNFTTALANIDRGAHLAYPCGAGAGYLGVSADGELSACHRFVGEREFGFGTLHEGVDLERQARWLQERHVDRQEPCRSCWARYQCGGGCHHEVIHRGRPACDYVRGWLDFCLGAYVRLARARPSLFTGGAGDP